MSAGTELTLSRSLVDHLEEVATVDPGRLYCTFGPDQITVGDLYDEVSRTATALASIGLRPGDRVATVLGNGRPVMAIMLAALATGLVWVPVNTRLRGAGLEHVLVDSDPSVVVVDPEIVGTDELPQATLDTTRVLISSSAAADGEFGDLVRAVEPGSFPYRAGLDDLACISYTSGTTGPAKGVLLTPRMYFTAVEGMRHTLEPRADDVLIVWEPLHHVGGNQVVVYGLVTGVPFVLLSKFSASRFAEQLMSSGATHVHHLGGVLQILVRNGLPPEATRAVRVVWGGGCPPQLWGQVEDLFGSRPREVYGMTETSSITTANLTGPAGSVGRALPWFEVAIADDDGHPVDEPGHVGEILVRDDGSGVLTTGYWRQQEATARLLPGDGWLHTGDSGYLDEDGYLFFLGRLNDSVRHRGENVSAWEVESVLNAHPAVEESAMVGVSTDVGEQDIKVYVRLADGASAAPAELIAWCEERMARHQVPRYLAYVDSLPKTPTERVRKELLADLDVKTWDRLAPHAGSDI